MKDKQWNGMTTKEVQEHWIYNRIKAEYEKYKDSGEWADWIAMATTKIISTIWPVPTKNEDIPTVNYTDLATQNNLGLCSCGKPPEACFNHSPLKG